MYYYLQNLYLQLVKYVCKICRLLQRDYYKIIISDYLAEVDQSDHRKITIILDKKVCLSQSVAHKKATRSTKSNY